MERVLDDIWLQAAARLDVPVVRGGDAYVHWDGRTLHLCDDEHLDADDTIAQLVLHELCHFFTQGERSREKLDWGLDNTSERDHARELSCLRLQAHLLGAYGLRGVLFPTTPVRGFYESLGADALENDPIAHAAASLAARDPFGAVLRQALSESAAHLARHEKSGRPLAPDGECGGCVWRSAGGFCRVAQKRVRAEARACAAFESALDCQRCGACCREAYDAVDAGRRHAVPEHLTERRDGRVYLRRAAGNRCAALEGHYTCTIYELRPKSCRDFERAGRHCLDARRKVGLTI